LGRSAPSREAAQECSPQPALSLSKGRKPWVIAQDATKPRQGRKKRMTTATEQKPPAQAPAKGILVTEKALAKVRGAMAKEGISPEQGGLRLGVQGGGCSGLSYNIRFDTQPRERDRIFQFSDVRVFVDPKSFIYLHGMTLDYQETLMQQGFVFVNPQASKSCGCGTSFSA
jgi:iron-sulfur cluster assembly protein